MSSNRKISSNNEKLLALSSISRIVFMGLSHGLVYEIQNLLTLKHP
jgi:hypothetical protein